MNGQCMNCACEMTGLEALQDALERTGPQKTILIIDKGSGWTVTMYGPDSFGDPAPETYRTVQATLERAEALLVNLRRQPNITRTGEVITDPQRIADELKGGL